MVVSKYKLKAAQEQTCWLAKAFYSLSLSTVTVTVTVTVAASPNQ